MRVACGPRINRSPSAIQIQPKIEGCIDPVTIMGGRFVRPVAGDEGQLVRRKAAKGYFVTRTDRCSVKAIGAVPAFNRRRVSCGRHAHGNGA